MKGIGEIKKRMFSLILRILSVVNFLFLYKNELCQFRNVFFLAMSI